MTESHFDREQIRAWLEEVTGRGLSVEEALPDTLAVTSEVLGIQPAELRQWIFGRSGEELSGRELIAWARRKGLNRGELVWPAEGAQ